MDSNITNSGDTDNGAALACSFCKRTQDETTRMATGGGAVICDTCAAALPVYTPVKMDPCSFCNGNHRACKAFVDGVCICDECLDVAAEATGVERKAPAPAPAPAPDLTATFARAAAASLALKRPAPAAPRECSDSGACECDTCKRLHALWTTCNSLRTRAEFTKRRPEGGGHGFDGGPWNARISPLTTRRAMLAAAAAAVAQQHGETLNIGTVTDEQIVQWEIVAKQDAEDAARKAREEAPLKESMARRRAASRAFAGVIPGAYASVAPVEAGETEDERKANAAALFSPDEFGRVRVKDKAAYRAAMDAAVAIANGKVRTVLLAGPSGSGKTHLAALMLRRIALEWERNAARGAVPEFDPAAPQRRPLDGDPVFLRLAADPGYGYRDPDATIPGATWQKSRDMFRAAVAPRAFPKDGQEAADPLDTAKRTAVAVLEDIGPEPSQANVAPMADVVWERYDGAGLVTIATTGFCDPEAAPIPRDADDMRRFLARLATRYDDAFVRRLSEPGVSVVIPVGCKPAKGTARTAPQSAGNGARRGPSASHVS